MATLVALLLLVAVLGPSVSLATNPWDGLHPTIDSWKDEMDRRKMDKYMVGMMTINWRQLSCTKPWHSSFGCGLYSIIA